MHRSRCRLIGGDRLVLANSEDVRSALLVRNNLHRRSTGDAKGVRTGSGPTEAASLLDLGLGPVQTALLLGASCSEDWYESGARSGIALKLFQVAAVQAARKGRVYGAAITRYQPREPICCFDLF